MLHARPITLKILSAITAQIYTNTYMESASVEHINRYLLSTSNTCIAT